MRSFKHITAGVVIQLRVMIGQTIRSAFVLCIKKHLGQTVQWEYDGPTRLEKKLIKILLRNISESVHDQSKNVRVPFLLFGL